VTFRFTLNTLIICIIYIVGKTGCYMVIQLTTIKTSFGRSCTVLEHRFKDVTLYSDLGGYVSIYVWATLIWKSNIAGIWKSNIAGKHCVWTRKVVVVFKGHPIGYHVHALLLLKFVTTCLFYWMRYTVIGIGYVWVKKVIKMHGFSVGDEWNGVQ